MSGLLASACSTRSGTTEISEVAGDAATPTTLVSAGPPTTRPAVSADLGTGFAAAAGLLPTDMLGLLPSEGIGPAEILALVQELGVDPAQFLLGAAQSDPAALLVALNIDPVTLDVTLPEIQSIALRGDLSGLLAALNLELDLGSLNLQFDASALLNALDPNLAATLLALLGIVGAGAAAGVALSAGASGMQLPSREVIAGLAQIAKQPLSTAIGYPLDESGTIDTIEMLQETVTALRTTGVVAMAAALNLPDDRIKALQSPTDVAQALGIQVRKPEMVAAMACRPSDLFGMLNLPPEAVPFLTRLYQDPRGTLAPMGDVTVGEILGAMGLTIESYLALTDSIAKLRDSMGFSEREVGQGLNALVPIVTAVVATNLLSPCGEPGAGLEPLLALVGVAAPLLMRR